MKKILFFINTLGTGGAEHVLVDIANNLDPKKFDITIKTIYDTNIYGEQLNSNIKFESYYKTKKNKLLDRIFRKILYLKLMNYSSSKLYNMIIKNKYDIEVAFLEGLPTKIISASSNSKSKKIAWVHCDLKINKDSDIFFNSELEQIDTYNKFDEIYCVSNRARQEFINRFSISDKVYTLYNIVDKDKVIKKSQEKVSLSDGFNIVTVGRLTKQKGFERLIEAYSQIIDKVKIKSHLYIIGDGEERKNIEEKIKNEGMQEHVTLLGNHVNPYKYMKNCDLYVCSSYSEGYSLAIVEALTLNLPVLTTDCADQKQMLNNGEFGMIVENDMQHLSNGLLRLLNNRKIMDEYKQNIEQNYFKYENNIKKIEEQLLK